MWEQKGGYYSGKYQILVHNMCTLVHFVFPVSTFDPTNTPLKLQHYPAENICISESASN